MKTYLLGVLTGAALAFSTGFFRAAGAAAWAACAKRWGKVRRAVQTRKQARKSERAAASAAALEASDRARLTAERVGAKFRRRYTADDTGTIVTVRQLRDPDWRKMVSVKEVAPAARVPTESDGQLPAQYGISWSDLTRSDAVQRHATARHVLGSFDDADGWIEFERLT